MAQARVQVAVAVPPQGPCQVAPHAQVVAAQLVLVAELVLAVALPPLLAPVPRPSSCQRCRRRSRVCGCGTLRRLRPASTCWPRSS